MQTRPQGASSGCIANGYILTLARDRRTCRPIKMGIDMAVSMTPGEAMPAQLNSIPEALRPPPDVFAQLLTAAGKLRAEGGSDDAQRAAVIYKHFEWGARYGADPPR